MSPSFQLSVLALASTVLATPYAGHNHHAHLHRAANAPAPYPLPSSNSSGIAYPSSGLPSTDTCTDTATSSAPVSPVAYSTPSAYPTPASYPSPSGYPSPSVAPSPSGYPSPSVYPSAVSSSAWVPSSWVPGTCAPVTVTATGWTVTVTVTAGGESSSSWSPPAAWSLSSSSSAAPAPPSYGSAPASSPIAYQAPSSSVAAAPVKPAAPATSAAPVKPAAPATSAAPVSVVSSAPVAAPAPSAPSSSAPAPSPSTSATGSGKRGLAFNDASLTSGFMGKPQVSWAYNWGSTPNGLADGVTFIPLLHGGEATFTDVWSVDAQAAINAGSKVLFSFNEPDAPSQANMSPADAAQAYMSYMQPFAGKADLCAPAVTNGDYTASGAPMGLNWLQEFLTECSECHIDCLNIHWYASGPTALSNFQEHLQQTAAMANGKPIWVSEYSLSGASPSEEQQFIQEVMPMMDNNSQVAGYAYYWVASGSLVDGDAPSELGNIYMDFTGST